MMRRKCKGKENPMTRNNSRLIDGRIRKLFEFREMVGEKEEKKKFEKWDTLERWDRVG